MNNEEKKAIEVLKEFKKTGFHTLGYKYNKDRRGTVKLIENTLEIILNLIEKQQKEIEDKKEEAIAIARANYILGQTDERSQWYKKINEKIEEIDEYEDTEYCSPPIYKTKKGIEILKEDAMLILEELIGKEE